MRLMIRTARHDWINGIGTMDGWPTLLLALQACRTDRSNGRVSIMKNG